MKDRIKEMTNQIAEKMGIIIEEIIINNDVNMIKIIADKKEGIKLPSYSEAGMRDKIFKDSYASLDEYLRGFSYTCAVMRTKDAIERISYELAIDNQK